MTLPVELETSVNQLRAKHTKLVDAVNAYLSGTITASKQELLDQAWALQERVALEEYTLLGQVARKGVMPSLVLDFAGGKYAAGTRRLEGFVGLDDVVDITRSTGGLSEVSSGVFVQVGPDEPRYRYKEGMRGLLVERQATNVLTGSGNAGVGVATDYNDLINTPFPGVKAYKVSDKASGAARFQIRVPAGSYASGEKVSLSIYYKPLRANVFEQVESSYSVNALLVIISESSEEIGEFKRLHVEATIIDGSLNTDLRVRFGGPSTPGPLCYVCGFQVEAGTAPTSLILTNGTAVTRDADLPLLPYGEWNNPRSGTYVLSYDLISADYPSAVTILGGSVSTYNPILLSTTGRYALDARGVGGSIASTTQAYVKGPAKAAYRYTVDALMLDVLGGAAEVSGAHDGLGSFAGLGRRHGYTDTVHMVLHSLTYYPYKLTAEQLQELTTP